MSREVEIQKFRENTYAHDVSYCGLYCPMCFNNVVSEAAFNLKLALENTHICGSKQDPSNRFHKELNELVNLKCSTFCKSKPESNCPIAIRCKRKKIAGCWECSEAEKCPQLTQQFKENCAKIIVCGISEFIMGYSPMRTKAYAN